MKNKIEDLREHLFAQLERLGDDEAMQDPAALDRELKRADAISKLSQVLVNSAKAETDRARVGGKIGAGGFINTDPSKQLGTGKD